MIGAVDTDTSVPRGIRTGMELASNVTKVQKTAPMITSSCGESRKIPGAIDGRIPSW
jgi:hypothetical protein